MAKYFSGGCIISAFPLNVSGLYVQGIILRSLFLLCHYSLESQTNNNFIYKYKNKCT